MFIRVERELETPVYEQICAAIRRMVATGALKAGDQLPSTRELAETLGVSRMTVDRAFAVLQAEGAIHSHVGQGSFVGSVPAKLKPRTHGQQAEQERTFWDSLLSRRHERNPIIRMAMDTATKVPYAFVSAMPDPAFFPVESFRRCVDFVLKKNGRQLTELSETAGYVPLREHIAMQLSTRGISVSIDEVLITTGCQQSIDLISRLLLLSGDAVVLENPTYPAAIHALTLGSQRSLPIPAPFREERLGNLQRLVNRERPRLIYVVPNFHNPTGTLMAMDVRKTIVDLATQNGIPLIEDDVFGDLYYEGPMRPSLKALDKSGAVIYINSFSKVLSPGLRVGWIVAPSQVIEQLIYLKETTDLQTNGILQAALDTFCRRGILIRHLKQMRKKFRDRRDAVLEALKRYFPRDTQWTEPQGGLAVWVTLDPSLDATKLLIFAQTKGVAFIPGEFFFFHRPSPNTLRLGFGTLKPTAIREGIKVLGSLLTSSQWRVARTNSKEARNYLVI